MHEQVIETLGHRCRGKLARRLALLTLAFGASAHAADSSELRDLNVLLDVLNREQQAVVQQIHVSQEMRRSNYPCGGQLPPPGMIDYDEWVDVQRSALRRENALRDRVDALHARWDELEKRKEPLLQRVYQLASPKE